MSSLSEMPSQFIRQSVSLKQLILQAHSVHLLRSSGSPTGDQISIELAEVNLLAISSRSERPSQSIDVLISSDRLKGKAKSMGQTEGNLLSDNQPI